MLNLFSRIKDFIQNQVRNPIIIFLRILSLFKLVIRIKNISLRNYKIDDLVDFTLLQKKKKILNLQQTRSEIIQLLKMVKKSNPKYILEIGTLDGGTLFLFSRIARNDALLLSIDLPKGKIGGPGSKWRVYSDWRIHIIKQFSHVNQRLELIRADSHDNTTLHRIKQILKGKKLDFIFIDADHSFNGVKKDFEMYSPLLKKGGLIAFHDIVPTPHGENVYKFWETIKKNFDFEEIIEDRNQKAGGIGILKK
ncbi:MAG: O-methyltransferase [Promethearchaeota archaeon]